MFRGGRELTEAEHGALVNEVERIEALGGVWEPTEGNLAAVVLAVKAAGYDEHAAVQLAGISKAQASGVKMGRPRKIPPAGFERYVRAVNAGAITKGVAADMLEVSRGTFNKWLSEFQATQESGEER